MQGYVYLPQKYFKIREILKFFFLIFYLFYRNNYNKLLILQLKPFPPPLNPQALSTRGDVNSATKPLTRKT